MTISKVVTFSFNFSFVLVVDCVLLVLHHRLSVVVFKTVAVNTRLKIRVEVVLPVTTVGVSVETFLLQVDLVRFLSALIAGHAVLDVVEGLHLAGEPHVVGVYLLHELVAAHLLVVARLVGVVGVLD